MKKFFVIGSLVAVLVIALTAITAVGFVSASAPTPQAPIPGQPGFGSGYQGGQAFGGMMGGRGSMLGAGYANSFGHTDMVEALAKKTGLTVDDINARLAKGQTMWQIAEEKGIKLEDFNALMQAAHTQAIDKALAAKQITPEQAQLMKDRSAQMPCTTGAVPGTPGQTGTFTPGGMRGGMNGGQRGGMRGAYQATPAPVKP